MSKQLLCILWAGTSTLIRAENNLLPLDNTAQGGGSNETHQEKHIVKNKAVTSPTMPARSAMESSPIYKKMYLFY